MNGERIIYVYADSCPDRWGRLLMKRREAIRAKKADEKPRKLVESIIPGRMRYVIINRM